MKLALILSLSLLAIPAQADTERKSCGRICGWGAGADPSPERATNCKRLNLCRVAA